MLKICLFFGCCLISLQAFAQLPAIGHWKGKLRLSGTSLRIGFNISEKQDKLYSTMDSPDQGAFDIPCKQTTYQNDTLRVNAPSMGMTYTAVVKGDSLIGKFKQAGVDVDLVLQRSDEKMSRKPKPQDPQAPFDYQIREVSFENKAADIQLAGTLTLPNNAKNVPVAILISGSGAQDRDETLLGHKPFWVIADHLTNNGIAVLRFDERGVGESTGKFSGSTSADFAQDVETAMDFLKTQQGIDAQKIGLIGHSEGGLIAPMIAARNADVAFIISLAGPGMIGKDLIPRQLQLISEAAGADPKALKKSLKISKKTSALIAKIEDDALLEKKLRKVLKKNGASDQVIEQSLKQYMSPWFRYFMGYDPSRDWAKVTCPVLALNGKKDLQVPAEENLRIIAQNLEKADNQDYTSKQLEELNHLFQHCKVGHPSEYGVLEETFAPEVLKLMSDWINERF